MRINIIDRKVDVELLADGQRSGWDQTRAV
jgi:hypothetical protein